MNGSVCQAYPTFSHGVRVLRDLAIRLGKGFQWLGLTGRVARCVYLGIVGILVGPVVLSALLPVRFAYYAEPGAGCMCGHRQYYFIKNDRFVSASLGHGDFSELFSLHREPDGTISLRDMTSNRIGTLTIGRAALAISTSDGEDRIPRAWNIWRVWMDRLTSDDLGEYESLEYWQDRYRELQVRREQNKPKVGKGGNVFGASERP